MTKKIIVETSARHIHLSDADLETLFGKGYQLTNKKDLSQPGQFACEEKVTVVGSKGEQKMSVLGPTRSATQVELSLTDARSLGLPAAIRESGDIEGTAGCKLIGPAGEVEIPCGVIAAKRHIHMTPADATEFGVTDKQIVKVEIETDGRSLVFKDVVCRVSESYATAMHIDTDESNAAGCGREVYGTIIK
ncbi:PduL/EutD family phosphate acyltransferase [Thomasclavelia cocleata]|uniref:Phosphate propanoyltransferase n=1 Tax=Thomasclavelia cocleata TaxID=69824 RepID=A0A829ZC12_9FIRM|nr:phosphate propanoyltransferase [Thomasclavelia cocleata]MCI9629872.1 phosphate propanoyltransferase [Thomasclavelia cocleata]GFI41943.1 phosphate propanoyltransferase [Thomasclavelia cocleata]